MKTDKEHRVAFIRMHSTISGKAEPSLWMFQRIVFSPTCYTRIESKYKYQYKIRNALLLLNGFNFHCSRT